MCHRPPRGWALVASHLGVARVGAQESLDTLPGARGVRQIYAGLWGWCERRVKLKLTTQR